MNGDEREAAGVARARSFALGTLTGGRPVVDWAAVDAAESSSDGPGSVDVSTSPTPAGSPTSPDSAATTGDDEQAAAEQLAQERANCEEGGGTFDTAGAGEGRMGVCVLPAPAPEPGPAPPSDNV